VQAIYEPKGRAKEYSPLACNLFTGCRHGCRYCYCPAILHKTLEQWQADPQPREGILQALERDAKKLGGMFPDQRDILFCFMSDPYQSADAAQCTHDALEICDRHGLRVQVLTKGGYRASPDFDLLGENKWGFGSTIIFDDDESREEWEPGAASIKERWGAIESAYCHDIYTWVSVEPVIDPEQALAVMHRGKGIVDAWKVGKINHHPEIEAQVDWADFLRRTREVLEGEQYYIKADLRKFE